MSKSLKKIVTTAVTTLQEEADSVSRNLNVGGYETEHFNKSPIARDNFNSMKPEDLDQDPSVVSAKLHDRLFALEKTVEKQGFAMVEEAALAEIYVEIILSIGHENHPDKDFSYLYDHLENINKYVASLDPYLVPGEDEDWEEDADEYEEHK